MKYLVAVLTLAVAALGWSAYSSQQQNKELSARVAALEGSRETIEAGLRKAQDEKLRGITPVAVGETIVSGQREALVSAVAAQIAEKYSGELKGPAEEVAEAIWARKKEAFVDNPALIAAVADKVYNTYGNDLRAKPVQAEKVAIALESEPAFVSLVAAMLEGRVIKK